MIGIGGMPAFRITKNQTARAQGGREVGPTAAEVCNKHRISSATVRQWEGKYRGLGSAEVCHLEELQNENRKLAELVARAMLINIVLKHALRRKGQDFSVDR
jgi:putative transposase